MHTHDLQPSSSRIRPPFALRNRGCSLVRGAVSWAALAASFVAILSPARAQSSLTTRIDLGPGGVQANLASWEPRITGDGRYVVYYSYAYTLFPGDTGFHADVFVYDSHTATTVRASVDSSGVQGNGDSAYGSISGDGRFVAFQSVATNLVANDTNGFGDIFVRDMVAGTTTRVSVSSSGVESNNFSLLPTISANGRYVVFESNASNLVAGDTNNTRDVFMRDLVAGTTTRVSVDSSGVQANGSSSNASISADGRYVVFDSTASNLVLNDNNIASDVFVHDNLTGATTLVSMDSFGYQGNGDSFMGVVSPTGRLVAFESFANDLVTGDFNGNYDVFVRDMVAGTTTRVSVDSSGGEGNGSSYDPAISSDERFVVFDSDSSNLVAGDTNSSSDIFIKDLVTQETSLASVATSGALGNLPSSNPSISDDGRRITFWSYATNLVTGDTNNQDDIFVRDRNATGFASLCDPGVDGVMACPCSNPAGGSGRGCNNSAATGGAALSASGTAYLSADSLVFTTIGEKPTATSILLQGTTSPPAGVVYGQGVRCVGGTFKRLFTKHAVAGSITAPDFGAGDPTVSARSSALGDVIQPGQSRWYLVYYRDPTVLGGCPASSTFNATQTGRIDWSL